MAWSDLTPEQKVAKLIDIIELSDEGVIRFKPLNADGQPHQRFSIGRTGISVSDDDPNPNWYASGNAYFGGRVGIQAQVGFNQSPDQARRDLSFVGKSWQAGLPSTLQVENTNIPDQVVVQAWQNSNKDDGLTEYVAWLTSGDSGRPHSRNVALRLDAVNDQGETGAKVTAVEANVFGSDPDNKLIDKSGSSNPAIGDQAAPGQVYVALPPPYPPASNWFQRLGRKLLGL